MRVKSIVTAIGVASATAGCALVACTDPLDRSVSTQLPAPPTLIVGDSAECRNCSLDLRLRANLGRTDGSLAPTSSSGIVRTRQGRMFIAPIARAGLVAAYDGTGRLVDTIRVASTDDEVELHAADSAGALYFNVNGELLVLDPSTPDSESRQLMRLPSQATRIIPLSGGEAIAIATTEPTRPNGGSSVSLYSRTGALRARLDRQSSSSSREPAQPAPPIIAPSASGGLWVGHALSNVIDLYDERGALQRRLVRRSAVFDSLNGSILVGDAAREIALPRLVAIVEDERGRLWTMTTYPRAAARSASRHSLTVSESLQRHEQLFATVIEVIDPMRGRLVQSALCPGWFMVFLDSRIVAALRSTAEERYSVEAWAIEASRLDAEQPSVTAREGDGLHACRQWLTP